MTEGKGDDLGTSQEHEPGFLAEPFCPLIPFNDPWFLSQRLPEFIKCSSPHFQKIQPILVRKKYSPRSIRYAKGKTRFRPPFWGHDPDYTWHGVQWSMGTQVHMKSGRRGIGMVCMFGCILDWSVKLYFKETLEVPGSPTLSRVSWAVCFLLQCNPV